MIDHSPERLPTDLEEWAFETARLGWQESYDRLGPPMGVPAQLLVQSRLENLLTSETGLPEEQAEEWTALAKIDHFEGLMRFPLPASPEKAVSFRHDMANLRGFIGRCLVPTALRHYFFRSKTTY